MKKYQLFVFFIIFIFGHSCVKAQTDFGASNWANATNLSSLFPNKSYEFSGLYWNDLNKQLFVVGDDGELYILSYNSLKNEFTLQANIGDLSSPEGIMQVDNSSNEFYIIDESGYKIRKYTFTTDFAQIDNVTSWNLLNSPSTMPDTGNSGPEGITFVPDWYLNKIGFISSQTNAKYQSLKGMGGLIFISSQTNGEIWVYDVNPSKKNDFLFVGKYKTSENESCELAFDNSTGLMYILHNTGSNSLEVTDLTTAKQNSNYVFNVVSKYNIPNPTSGDTNIEGFALTPKYSNNSEVSVWLCRDISSSSESSDCLRWFHPYNADGENIIKSDVKTPFLQNEFDVVKNNSTIKITSKSNIYAELDVQIFNSMGQLMISKNQAVLPLNIQLNQKGIFIVSISQKGKILYKTKVML